MEAKKVYARLEKDFITDGLSDDWARHMGKIKEFISENFQKRSMGLVCDFTKEINYAYTAVFPSDKVLKKVFGKKRKNCLLFVHHPAIWDIRKAPKVFQQMNPKLLQQMKKQKISIYNLHVPLDNYGEYSTSRALAEALKIKPKEKCAPYFGGMAGVIGTTKAKTVQELQKTFEKAVGHKTSLYNYGSNRIAGGKVAIVAGGGNDPAMLEEISGKGINTFVTGITAKNDHSKKAHEVAAEKKINLLGGTHYSTEKFACEKMCKYFNTLGLKSEFIKDRPAMDDL